MPTNYPGDRQVATYVPVGLADAIDAAATRAGLSRAAYVRTILVKALGLPGAESPTSGRAA